MPRKRTRTSAAESLFAARGQAQQGEVWRQVAAAQDKLGQAVGKEVRDGRSASSLQLTLEDADIEKQTHAYVEALLGCPEGTPGVIGFAAVINGEVNSAEVYGSRQLFATLWPKMLRSVAVEALAEFRKDEAFPEITEI